MSGENFKVIDENGISREAKILTTINDDGKEYVIYVIGRDGDNSNIFVSRLENGSFVDIVDSVEKNRIDDKVKDIIKKAME